MWRGFVIAKPFYCGLHLLIILKLMLLLNFILKLLFEILASCNLNRKHRFLINVLPNLLYSNQFRWCISLFLWKIKSMSNMFSRAFSESGLLFWNKLMRASQWVDGSVGKWLVVGGSVDRCVCGFNKIHNFLDHLVQNSPFD